MIGSVIDLQTRAGNCSAGCAFSLAHMELWATQNTTRDIMIVLFISHTVNSLILLSLVKEASVYSMPYEPAIIPGDVSTDV